ncbi:MAG: NAD(P)-dependent oxidoreductase [Alphaproteobacteria bacterium]
MTKIVYVGAPEGFDSLREVAGSIACVHAEAEPATLAAALADADALLDASMKVRITDEMVAAAPALKIVSCATTGADHIARGELGRRGAPVRTLREDGELLRNITPAAELSFGLVLACARKLVPAVAHTRAGQWVREDFPAMMLHGRTLGLVGCGRIGQWMARYGTAFGMRCIGHDPHVEPWPETIVRTPIEDLVAEADVISVHVHLSDETRGLLSADLLARARPGVIVINTSRGGIVSEHALLAGLESGRIGAAGLDVLDGEPDIAAHPLVHYAQTHDNLLITPHCGGFSPDAVRVVCRRAAEKIVDHLGLA